MSPKTTGNAQSAPFQLVTTDKGAILKFNGDITSKMQREIRAFLLDALSHGLPWYHADITNIERVSSVLVGLLLSFGKSARTAGHLFGILCSSNQLEIFSDLGVSALFPVDTDRSKLPLTPAN